MEKELGFWLVVLAVAFGMGYSPGNMSNLGEEKEGKSGSVFESVHDVLSDRSAATDSPDTMKTADACKEGCTFDDGYAWAQENGIEEREECYPKSKAFVQGCHAYLADISSPAAAPTE